MARIRCPRKRNRKVLTNLVTPPAYSIQQSQSLRLFAAGGPGWKKRVRLRLTDKRGNPSTHDDTHSAPPLSAFSCLTGSRRRTRTVAHINPCAYACGCRLNDQWTCHVHSSVRRPARVRSRIGRHELPFLRLLSFFDRVCDRSESRSRCVHRYPDTRSIDAEPHRRRAFFLLGVLRQRMPVVRIQSTRRRPFQQVRQLFARVRVPSDHQVRVLGKDRTRPDLVANPLAKETACKPVKVTRVNFNAARAASHWASSSSVR